MSAACFLAAATATAADPAVQAALPSGAVPPLAWWRLALLLVLFAGLIGLWAYLNRSRFSLRALAGGANAPGRKIEVRDQRWLTSRTAIALVEVDGQKFLLAYGPDTATWQPLQPLQPAPAKPPQS